MRTTPASHDTLRDRIDGFDWPALEAELDARGYARLAQLLDDAECDELIRLYSQPEHFRKTVEMSRHAFGEGRYRYFAYPLPELIEALRTLLYPTLAAIANRWCERMREKPRYPASLASFLEVCHAAGQKRPTPLLLHYATDGYNRMHQDLYGAVAFPLQLACLLSSPASGTGLEAGASFVGGEFLISEQRPRMQTRAEAIRLERGEAVLFANAVRPVRSARGHARAQMRHGLSRVRAGERFALGIIFHDAE